MANLEDEIRDLREKNSELVQEVQYLKIADAQRQKENLELMKENNELRLKLSRLKSSGEAQARKLDSALQSASANALSHLVQASGAIARTIELTKQYIQERQELESASPRWSAMGSSPSTDKVHKVPPLLLGGQSIQPVVALSRTILDSSTRSVPRTPNQNSSVTERAVPIPMHMLQDLYIPLQRIDLAELQGSNTETEQEADVDDINDSNDQSLLADESNNLSRVDELEESSRLEAVTEDVEPEEDDHDSMRRSGTENPLEGPSWLLDLAHSNGPRPNFEPDSTTPCDGASSPPTPMATTTSAHVDEAEKENTPTALAFTPTMRRRKRSCTPPESPRPKGGRRSGRVLKVMVAKMRPAEEALAKGESSPPKRPALADARGTPHMPSPNGNTHGSLAKSEAEDAGEPSFVTVGRSRRTVRARLSPDDRDGSRSRTVSRASNAVASLGDSDSSVEFPEGDGRTRRARKQVSYKEKSLNRKLRR